MVLWQPVIPRPFGLHAHRGQVPACRVAAHADARRVTTKFGNVAHRPGHRSAHLAHDLIDGDKRAQGVIHHHGGDAARVQAQRHAAEVFAGERPPVAAMDKNKHRRAAGPAGRSGKNIQRLSARGPKRNIQVTGQAAAGQRTDLGVVAARCRGIGQTQRGVVLLVDLRLCREVRVQKGVGVGRGGGWHRWAPGAVRSLPCRVAAAGIGGFFPAAAGQREVFHLAFGDAAHADLFGVARWHV